MKKKKLTRCMLAVCRECFDNDWSNMVQFAKQYNSQESDPEVLKKRGAILGENFRRLIGSRNRKKFWKSVSERDYPFDTDSIINGDSISQLRDAFRMCSAGKPVMIQVEDQIIGMLTPLTS